MYDLYVVVRKTVDDVKKRRIPGLSWPQHGFSPHTRAFASDTARLKRQTAA